MAECFSCKARACYTCPRCFVAYCSLGCYRDLKHAVCSESFYKHQVREHERSQDKSKISKGIKDERIRKVLKEDEDLDHLQRVLDSLKTEKHVDDLDEETVIKLCKNLGLNEKREPWWREGSKPVLVGDVRVGQGANGLEYNCLEVLLVYVDLMLTLVSYDGFEKKLVDSCRCLNDYTFVYSSVGDVMDAFIETSEDIDATIDEVLFILESGLQGACFDGIHSVVSGSIRRKIIFFIGFMRGGGFDRVHTELIAYLELNK